MRVSQKGLFSQSVFSAAMPTIAAVLVVLSAVLCFSSPVMAQTKPDTQTPRVARAEARAMISQLVREGKIMRPGDAKRGMRGIGRSVFQGTKIEEFHIEVIGTLKKVMGGGDLVLIKVLDGPVVKRNTGIIAGMSGSPVYINGKMLGAIAIGFGFPKEPIGGVTPITQMIEGALPDNTETKPTVKNSIEKRAALQSETYRTGAPIAIGGQRISQVVVSRNHSQEMVPGTLVGRPCTMLMQMAGFSPASLPRLKKMMEPFGIEPVLGTGGVMSSSASPVQAFSAANEKTDVNPPFIPGGAIGVPLVTGDLDMSGVGTITFRWGKRILAFGHPMFGKGAVSMPMTSAYIHDIFPSYQQSFKLASPVREVGALQQDTEFAIGGTIGRRADMVPMHVHLKNAERDIDRSYNVRLIKDPVFTPMLLQMVSSEALGGAFGMDSDKMVRVKFRMEMQDLPTIEKEEFLYAQSDVMMPALGDMFETIMLTQMNPFSRGDIKRVDLDVSLEPKRRTAIIKSIEADRNRAKAGDNVRVNVLLEPHDTPGQYITRVFNFKVPDDSPDGALRITVNPASDYWQGQSRVGGAPPDPDNLKELVEAYQKAGASNEILVQASTPQAYLMVGRQKVANPPSSWARLMPSRASTNIAAYNETQIQRDKVGFSLTGAQYLSIPIESARHSDRERPDTGTTADGKAGAASSAALAAAMAAEEASADSGFDPSDYETDELALMRLPFARQMQISPLVGPDMQLWWNRLSASYKVPLQSGATPPAAAEAITPSITPSISPVKTPASSAEKVTDTVVATAEPDTNLARPVSRWIQDDAKDFSRGTFEGTATSSDGMIRPAPHAELLATTTQPVGWSIAADRNGYTYMGSGHKAQIYRIDAKGKTTLLYDGPEVAVTALNTDEAGNLYAGVTPGAKVLRFSKEGFVTTIFDGEETFVWALERDAQGRLLIATGGGEKTVGGAIYRLDDAATRTEPKASVPLARVPQRHVRSLAVRGSDIFAGTGDEDAVLYQVSGETGALKALYEAGVGAAPSAGYGGYDPNLAAMMMNNASRAMMGGGAGRPMMGADAMMLMAGASGVPMMSGAGLQAQGTEILAIAAMPDGIYFGTANSGTIYRWTPERGAIPVYAAPARAVYALRAQNGKLFAAVAGSSGAAAQAAQISAAMTAGTSAIQPISLPASNGAHGAVYEIDLVAAGDNADNTRAVRLVETTQPQVLAIALSPGGDLLAATGNNAAVYRVPLAAQGGGTYTSNVLDAGRLVRWGALRSLSKNAPLETRSGNTLEPDATWSDWQSATKTETGEARVASPPARYLQYRAKLASDGSLSRVEAIYRPQNQAPAVQFASPVGGEFLKAKKKLTWKGKDPDSDTLRYRLWLSRDSGAWQPVELKKNSAASYAIEADKWPDGSYRAKVEASDRERNPEDPRLAEMTSSPFTIDNTAPKLDGQTVQKQEGAWRVRALASDELSPIIGAEWRVFVPEAEKKDEKAQKEDTKDKANAKDAKADAKSGKIDEKTDAIAILDESSDDADGDADMGDLTDAKKDEAEWHALAASDGIFDARREEVIASIEKMAAQGKIPEIKSGTVIEIRVRDAAGNSTTVQVTLS